jgi:hypothetical protein
MFKGYDILDFVRTYSEESLCQEYLSKRVQVYTE